MNNKDITREFLRYMSTLPYITTDQIPNIDLYMDQVLTFMSTHLANGRRNEEDKILTKTMINNYAKNKILPPPVNKKYNREHILYLTYIFYLKNILSISDIKEMLELLDDLPLQTGDTPEDEKAGRPGSREEASSPLPDSSRDPAKGSAPPTPGNGRPNVSGKPVRGSGKKGGPAGKDSEVYYPDFESVYRLLVSDIRDQEISLLMKDVAFKLKAAQKAVGKIAGIAAQDRSRLETYLYLCFLGFDVYVKKQLMERIIDEFSREKTSKPSEKDSKKKKKRED